MPWFYAVDFGAHSIPSPSSTLQGTSHSSEALYGMYRVPYLWRTNIRYVHFSSPPQKLLSKSSSRGLKYLARHYWRLADKLLKVCLYAGFHVAAYWMANGTLCLQMQNTGHRARLARSRVLGTRRQGLSRTS